MWVSSFAVDGAAASHTSGDASTVDIQTQLVKAHVWGSESVPLTKEQHQPAERPSTITPADALTLVSTANIQVLKHLRLVNGSYVRLSYQKKSHIGRLLLTSAEDVYTSSDREQNENANNDGNGVIGEITISPLLAFNLGIPLHAIKATHVSVTVSIRPVLPQELGIAVDPVAGPSSFRRKSQEQPAHAAYAMIAPLMSSSISRRQHAIMQQRDGLLESIRRFFATPQVLQQGDIFAVTLHETTRSNVPANTIPRTNEYKPYKHVEIPSSYLAESQDQASVLMPPTLSLDTSLVFFRVEMLEKEPNKALAWSVSDATELVQATSISAQAPSEEPIKRFLAYCQHHSSHIPLLPLETQVQSKALNQLYEMLYPSQLCEIPVSVLLSGPRGVGKTTLVHQAAKHLGVFTIEVSFTELTGQSELHLLENVREQVAKAQALSPCLLYISRFFPVEKDNEEAELRIGAVLTECIRNLSQSHHNIPLIACVEDVNEVPKFIRQCFLYEMQLEAPDQSGRLEFLQHASALASLHDDVDLKEIAQLTAGRTCGELAALVADAGALAIERIIEGTSEDELIEKLTLSANNDEGAPKALCSITTNDIQEAIKKQQALSSSAKTGNASIPNVKWEDVGGLEDVKEEILDVVQLPIKHPELFASGVRQRSGILLYGPPGTGKTLLAKAIATECNLNFLSVKGPELLNMYIGESEKNVRQVFAKARSCRPCVLFFDELDSLAPMRGRGSDSGGVMDRVVSQLLTEIDGLSGSSSGSDQVFVIGATNRPDLLETGLLRPGRFDRLLYLGICNEKAAQMKVVQALTRKFTLAPDVDLEAVVENCPLNFTGADFYALCSSALAAALKDRVVALDRQIEEINAADCYSSSPMTVRTLLSRLPQEELLVPVGQEHFLSALKQVVPSVSPAELRHYEKLKEQYSSK